MRACSCNVRPGPAALRRPARRVARPARRPPSASAGLDALVQEYVCPLVDRCAGLDLGDEQRQNDVMSTFYDLTAAYVLDHGEGYVLRALLQGDWPAVRELCIGFDAYNAGLSLIHAGIDHLHPLAPHVGTL